MNASVIDLRRLHLGSVVFWVGVSLVMGLYISPALAVSGDAGQHVLAHLILGASSPVAIVSPS